MLSRKANSSTAVPPPLKNRWLLFGVALLTTAVLLPPAVWAQTGDERVQLLVRVSDARNETPIEIARVELLQFPEGFVQQAFTDGSGMATLGPLSAPQRYVVRAEKQGYKTSEMLVETRRGAMALTVNLPMERVSAQTDREAAPSTVSAQALVIPESARRDLLKVADLLDRKKLEEGLRLAQRVVHRFPALGQGYFFLGMIQVQRNRPPEAEVALRRAIELDQDLLSAYYPLAVLLIARGQHAEGESLLQKALERDAQDWKFPYELARSLANRGEWANALDYAELAHARPQPATKVHILLADIYSALRNDQKAISELEEFLELDPSSPFVPEVKKALASLHARPANN